MEAAWLTRTNRPMKRRRDVGSGQDYVDHVEVQIVKAASPRMFFDGGGQT